MDFDIGDLVDGVAEGVGDGLGCMFSSLKAFIISMIIITIIGLVVWFTIIKPEREKNQEKRVWVEQHKELRE